MSGSLQDRMAARAETLATVTDEVFPVPGYEEIFGVRLKALSYEAIRKIQKKNERVRHEPTRELYNMADQIIAATVGFVEFPTGEGETQPIERDGETWVSLAKNVPHAPDEMTTRQAVLFIHGPRLMFLVQDWAEWQRVVQPENEEEVRRDFAPTG